MSTPNLVVRSRKSLGGIVLDAVLLESHSNTIRTTDNPVELGAEIADHAVIEPKVLNLIVEVTDTPFGKSIPGEVLELSGVFGSSTESNVTRSTTAYNAMVSLAEAREPLSVQTKLRLYDNMLITSLKINQDKGSSHTASMDILLKEIIIVQSKIVQLSRDQLKLGSPLEQGTSPDNRGRQEPITPNKTINKSVLKSTLDWVR